MNKAVYTFVLGHYGRSTAYWFGVFTEVIRTLLMRVVTVLITARIAGSVAVGDFAEAKQLTVWFLAATIVAVLVGSLGEVIAITRAENRIYHVVAMDFYRRLIRKDMAFYKDHHTGYLTALFRQHIDAGILLARTLRMDVVRLVVTLIATVGTLLWVSMPIGLVGVGVIMVQLVYITWASRRANMHRRRSHEAYRALSGAVADDITNILALKSAGNTKRAEERVSAFDREEADAFNLRRKVTISLDVPRAVVTSIGSAVAFWIIASQAGSTQVAVQSMVLIITYLIQISRNVDLIPDLITTLDDLVTKLHPTLQYLNGDYEKIRDPAKPKKIAHCKGGLTVKDIHFAYTSDKGAERIVFDGFDLRVQPGEQVGVVGLSGAGKSTLASLIMRFDDVGSGSISIDGVNIRDLRQDDLHQLIAYVPQEPLLFHRSIRENIMYYRPDATETEMIRAAKAAHAHEFITKLSDGYDTLVGERGIKLSGGQKQRIAIARAVLKNAPIMLFDEATSALDSESERIIQSALPEIIGKRTALVIAHRLSTIAGLDRIIVMHDGRIEERGTHTELLGLKGRYYSLWQKQTKQ